MGRPDVSGYELIRQIGMGAKSEIYQAMNLSTGKTVAIKVVRISGPEDRKYLYQVRNEFAIGSELDHPNIVRIHKLDMVRRIIKVVGANLIMEYVSEGSLLSLYQHLAEPSIIFYHVSMFLLIPFSIVIGTIYSREKNLRRDLEKLVSERTSHLLDSQARLMNIFTSSQDAIMILDRVLNVVDCNRSAVDLFGYPSKEEMRGADASELVDVGDSELFIGNMEDVRAIGSMTNIRYSFVDREGRRFPGEFSASVLNDPSGKAMGYVAVARDVTDRRRKEEELSRSEEKFQAISMHAVDAIITMDEHEKISYWNPAAESIFGYTPDEALGSDLPELIIPRKYRQAFRKGFEKFRETGQGPAIGNPFELYGKKKDGAEFPLELSLSSMRTEDGWQAIGIIRDISVRERMGDELRDRNWALGERVKELNCLYGISELVEQSGVSLDGILQGVVDLIPPAWQHPEVTCARVAVGDDVFTTERFRETEWRQSSDIVVRGVTKGVLAVFYLEEMPDFDEGPFLKEERSLIDAIVERLGSIIEHKRMEDELKQYYDQLEEIVKAKTMELSVSDERLRSFMASAPDAFTVYDSELNCLDVNEALLKYWPEGTTKEDLIGKNMLDLDPDIKETGRYDRYLEVIKTGKPFQMEDIPISSVFGGARLSLKAFKVGEGLGIITTDITDWIRMKEELVEAERMSAVGRVSAMVGHDLRGPLQNIKNALYLMEMTPEKAGELRETIGESADYAARILDDLRYSTRDIPVHLQELSVGALLQKTLASSSVPDSIEVDLDVGEGLDSVWLDPVMMQRVLDNLVRNSVEAMEDGGVLSMTAFQEPDGVIIKVSDTGIGIPEEDLNHIFTLFFTSKPGGMGLGLAYCKRAVEAHGGTIKVESEVDRGTTFTVRIPMKHE